jgi:DNA mismatch repair protein MutS2
VRLAERRQHEHRDRPQLLVRLDAAAEAGKKEEKKLLEDRRRADLKELRLRQKEFQLRSDCSGSFKNLLGESRKTLENLVRELKEGELNREKTIKVKEFLSALEEKVLSEDDWLEKEKVLLAEERRRLEYDSGAGRAGDSGNSTALAAGVEVLAGESRRRGRILRPGRKGSGENPDSWIVEIGSLKISFRENELTPIGPRKEASNQIKKASWQADIVPSSPSIELNLLGMRLGEAIETLNRQSMPSPLPWTTAN